MTNKKQKTKNTQKNRGLHTQVKPSNTETIETYAVQLINHDIFTNMLQAGLYKSGYLMTNKKTQKEKNLKVSLHTQVKPNNTETKEISDIKALKS